MNANPIAQWLALVLLAAAGAGCGSSPPARFYTLASTAAPDGTPALRGGVLVGPVSVPASVDRAQIAVQVAPNRVELDEFHRWAAPLGEGIARAVAGDLAVLLGTPDVAVAPFANFEADYRVTIDVQRFESVAGESALLEAVWAVRGAAGATRTGRTVAREAPQDASFDALAAAHSRALARLGADVAAGIRAAAAAR